MQEKCLNTIPESHNQLLEKENCRKKNYRNTAGKALPGVLRNVKEADADGMHEGHIKSLQRTPFLQGPFTQARANEPAWGYSHSFPDGTFLSRQASDPHFLHCLSPFQVLHCVSHRLCLPLVPWTLFTPEMIDELLGEVRWKPREVQSPTEPEPAMEKDKERGRERDRQTETGERETHTETDRLRDRQGEVQF